MLLFRSAAGRLRWYFLLANESLAAAEEAKGAVCVSRVHRTIKALRRGVEDEGENEKISVTRFRNKFALWCVCCLLLAACCLLCECVCAREISR